MEAQVIFFCCPYLVFELYIIAHRKGVCCVTCVQSLCVQCAVCKLRLSPIKMLSAAHSVRQFSSSAVCVRMLYFDHYCSVYLKLVIFFRDI